MPSLWGGRRSKANTKICADLTGMELRDIIDNLVSANGQTTIAAKMDIDPSILSRFRSGQGALSMAHLSKLFELAGVLLIQRDAYIQEQQKWMMELRKTEDALLIMSRKWEQERTRQSRRSDPGNGSHLTLRGRDGE
jgi:hypothetical protein